MLRLSSKAKKSLVLAGIGVLLIALSPLLNQIEARFRLASQKVSASAKYDAKSSLLSLGSGEEEVVVYFWWRCPSCKRLFLEYRDAFVDPPAGKRFLLKPVDFSPQDTLMTASVLCAPQEEKVKAFFRMVEGEPPKEVPEACVKEAESLGEKVKAEWEETGFKWTPALVVKGTPIPLDKMTKMTKEDYDELFGKAGEAKP
jgi:hypothetical protein